MKMKSAVQVTYFLLRVVAGFLFIQTGGLILFGWFGGMPGGEKVRLMSQTGMRRQELDHRSARICSPI